MSVDVIFLRQRAADESALADQCGDTVAGRVHRQLAALYHRQLAALSEEQHPPIPTRTIDAHPPDA